MPQKKAHFCGSRPIGRLRGPTRICRKALLCSKSVSQIENRGLCNPGDEIPSIAQQYPLSPSHLKT
jgi:hypothetical protein